MTRRMRSLVVPALLAFAAAFPAGAAITTSEDLQRVCAEVGALELDPASAHDVKGATLIRDIGTLRLDKGVLVFSKKVEGVVPAAVFLGSGSFSLTPTRKMDREMLDITTRDHATKAAGGMLTSAVSQAVLFGFDGTWEDLRPALGAARAAAPAELADAAKILREQLDVAEKHSFGESFFGREVGVSPEFDVIAAALGDPTETGDSLRAEIRTADFGWLSFAWLPSSTYEVRLGTRELVGAYLDYHPLVFTHRKEDFNEKGKVIADPQADRHEVIKVERYLMDAGIPTLEEISIDVDVTFRPTIAGLRMVAFDLVNEISGPRWDSRAKYVDLLSLTTADGKPLPHIHRKHKVLILPPGDLASGQEVTWKFSLKEKTIQQYSDSHFSLLNTFPWYPQYGYLGGQFEYDWTIKTVAPYTATGSGTPVKQWKEGNLNAIQMVSERPVLFPSVIFGRYQAEEGEYRSTDGRTVALAVHSWPQTRFPVGTGFVDVSVPRNKPRDVVTEAQSILKFLEDLYGPFPYDRLDVAMMAPGMGFGQAPPGFVQLTGEAFMSSALIAQFGAVNADFFHEFYAHELSHQWWGHKISWVTDEDTWLSEAFAEYSSGLYVLGLLGKKRWSDKLREWKEQAAIGDPHGTIAWCNNLSGVNGGQWRTQLIYNKGPYVVHMLRMMLGKEKFSEAMKSAFTKHGYRMVTTDAIQEASEQAAGYSLDFFFNQWFRGTGIPVFDYSWESAQSEDGKYTLAITTRQRDKNNFKQVLMPIYIYFEGEAEPLIRPRPMTAPEDVYRLKVPKKPIRVVLDEDHDILGDMIPASGSGM